MAHKKSGKAVGRRKLHHLKDRLHCFVKSALRPSLLHIFRRRIKPLSESASGSPAEIPAALLLEGEEEVLKQRDWQQLRHLILPEGMEDLNESLLDAPETDALIAAAETVPFLADTESDRKSVV